MTQVDHTDVSNRDVDGEREKGWRYGSTFIEEEKEEKTKKKDDESQWLGIVKGKLVGDKFCRFSEMNHLGETYSL